MSTCTPILNLADADMQARPNTYAATGDAGERFDAKTGQVSRIVGARQLGYNITAVPPGRAAYPFHNHLVNEEMFLVLEGRGEIRIGSECFPIRQHDIIACPKGGADTAHQIKNTGDRDLVYLAVSTNQTPEIAEYPDSGKFGVYSPGPDAERPGYLYISRQERALDYWEGE